MLESESVPRLERIARFIFLLDFVCLHREAYACSREEDMRTCCFCNCIRDVDPRPLDPNDIYQQFQIIPYATACRSGGTFYATSILPDAFPPYFLRTKGWEIYTKTPKNYELGEALARHQYCPPFQPSSIRFPTILQELRSHCCGEVVLSFHVYQRRNTERSDENINVL